ncbi:hypothetical protein JCM19231_5755 [Vibrio ishigakensis]|uniref:Cytochrome c551 peroxidase n=1 Tax=Vibrio ishigakensis TaxID=1481914 RepID=A0A0B8P3V4_9VIBR|nr:hypothetical protein JCM19231_5755 [Vibrio ishigakensis]
MAKVQLGKELSEQSIEDIHSFLQTLTGEKPQILQGGVKCKKLRDIPSFNHTARRVL